MSLFNYLSDDSLFITQDPRQHRWAIPFHADAVNTRAHFLLGENREFIENMHVLDCGCYFGTFSYLALSLGASFVTGVDSESALIDKAGVLFQHYSVDSSRYQFHVNEIHSYLLSLPANSVDTALCFGLLYYVPDPLYTLRLIANVVRHAIIIDTFTAAYALVQGKDSLRVGQALTEDALQYPLLVYTLSQSEKSSYLLPDKIQKPTNNKLLSVLSFPTDPLLNIYFQLSKLKARKIDWSPVLRNPTKSWAQLVHTAEKKESHWTDVYSSGIRVSYVAKKV